MSEEAVIEEGSVDTPLESNNNEVQYTEIELEAMEQGWNPEGVEGKRTLTAEEFLDRKPIYDRLHKQDKTIKDLRKGLEAMQQHEKMVRGRMHQDHLAELKAAKKEAFERFDYDAVEKIDEDIHQAKVEYDKTAAPAVPVVSAADIQATLEVWVEKNTWYTEDKVMKRFAEGEGQDFRKENPDASFDEVLDHIAKVVKKEFPEKFQNMSRTKPSSVEGSATGGRRVPATPKQKSVKDLPEEAVSVMKTLVRAGAFKTEQDYVNDYFNQK